MSDTGVYLGNPLLKKANVPHDWTKEQIQEYLKCKDDPVYFALNYVKIVSVDEGLIPFRMYEFQKDFETLKNKLTRNKFKKVSSKNKHFYCFMSIVNEDPDRNMIKELLHYNYIDSLRRRRIYYKS